jgi:hypothetical protein
MGGPCSRSWGQLWGQLRGLTFNFLSNFSHWNDYSVASLATTSQSSTFHPDSWGA